MFHSFVCPRRGFPGLRRREGRPDKEPSPVCPRRKVIPTEVSDFLRRKARSSVDRIVYIGHATVLIELDGVRLLTDPVLGRWVGPLHRQGAAPAAEVSEGVDAGLISHLHRDHLDLRSLRRLGRAVPLIVPAGTRDFFAQRGYSEVVELAPGQSHRISAGTITATAADHEIGRRGIDGEAGGYLVEGTRRVYFPGDTDVF